MTFGGSCDVIESGTLPVKNFRYGVHISELHFCCSFFTVLLLLLCSWTNHFIGGFMDVKGSFLFTMNEML